MIQVKKRVKNGRFSLTLKGHADYGPGGSDIVCAAASMLAQALAKAAADDGTFKPGNIRITGEASERHKAMLDMASAGYSLLQARYPDNITFDEKSD